MDEAADLTETNRRVLLAELRGLVERALVIVDEVERDLGIEDD